MGYSEHEVFTPPDDSEARIWRYVDFTKLVSLLETGSLFFARADTLGDDFEGSFSLANIQHRPEIYKDVPKEMLAKLPNWRAALRRHTYVNCWHVSEYESAALWSVYAQAGGGVAVRSTFRRLTESFAPSAGNAEDDLVGKAIYAGLVRYADYVTELIPEGNTMSPFVHKRRSFEYESELRAVIQHLPTVEDPAEGEPRIDLDQPSPLGRAIPVDLDCLIEAIYVSPVAAEWFQDLVVAVCARYGLRKPVVHSALGMRPVY